ncbi:MAG: ABC transporter permease [Rhodospirillales bacterium]|nr:MAG: ABC transporter permease [Rhodospirillales bacterium]
MTRFLLGRVAEMLAVLLAMSAVVFALIGLMPGDPVDLLAAGDPKMTSEDAARLRALYGLDRPVWARYLSWLGAALGGDLGFSRSFARPVLDVLLPRLADTALLVGLALVVSAAIALPLGVHAARHPRSAADYGVNLLCFAGISVPPFWLALMLIVLFSVVLRWLPASGVGEGPWQHARHLVLPLTVLVVTHVGQYTRFVRAATIEVLRQDYIRTARAKGLSERDVVRRHALRGALAPVFTIIALSFGGLFSGALITETMFARPGMGKAIYDAILGSDYNLALVGLLLATAATLVGSLLADIGYAWLDPRVRLGGTS